MEDNLMAIYIIRRFIIHISIIIIVASSKRCKRSFLNSQIMKTGLFVSGGSIVVSIGQYLALSVQWKLTLQSFHLPVSCTCIIRSYKRV